MKELEVLGSGCPNCKKLYELTEKAAKELGIEYNLVKIEDISKIMEYNVMMMPALVADGEVVLSGRVPQIGEIKKLIG